MQKHNMQITALKLGKESDERVVVDFTNVKSNDIIIDGEFGGKRNDIDTLAFDILYTHTLWNWLTPFDTYIYFKRADRWEFCGRILMVSTIADSQGIKRSITCESMEGLLNDYVNFETLENLGSTPKDTVTNFIKKYNAIQPSLKQIKMLNFDEPMYDYTDFVINLETGKTAMECLCTYLDRVGATMNIRRYDSDLDGPGLESTDLVMNIYSKDNNVFRVNQAIEIGENMQEISHELDYTKMRNKIKFIGKDDLSVIKEDTANQKIYGVIEGQEEEKDIDSIEALNEYADNYMKVYSDPFVSITTKPYDLSFIKDNLDSFKVGNIVRTINPIINIDTELYIEELSYNLLTYYDVTVTVANKRDDYLRELIKT